MENKNLTVNKLYYFKNNSHIQTERQKSPHQPHLKNVIITYDNKVEMPCVETLNPPDLEYT